MCELSFALIPEKERVDLCIGCEGIVDSTLGDALLIVNKLLLIYHSNEPVLDFKCTQASECGANTYLYRSDLDCKPINIQLRANLMVDISLPTREHSTISQVSHLRKRKSKKQQQVLPLVRILYYRLAGILSFAPIYRYFS